MEPDPNYLHEKVTEAYGTEISPNSPNASGCYVGVEARLFKRRIYREPNHPELLVEQVVYGKRKMILDTHLPQRAKNGPEELHEELINHAPYIGKPQKVIFQRDSMTYYAGDLDWNNVAQTLSTYAQDNGAFPRTGRRMLSGLLAEVSCGDVQVMTPELGWTKSHYQAPAGNVHDTLCAICRGSYEFHDPNHIHRVIELPCRHVFHKTCIYNWMWTQKEYNNRDTNSYCFCPICKTFI